MSSSVPSLLIFFHGPWGLAVDTTANRITAATPTCADHHYLIWDRTRFQPLPSGACFLTDESAIAPLRVTDFALVTEVPTVLAPAFPRLTIPDPAANANVYCTFALPDSEFHGCVPVERCDTAVDRDNLLSGAQFGLLTQTDTSRHIKRQAYLPLVPMLRYQLVNAAALQWISSTGAATLPFSPTASGDVHLHLFAQAVVASQEDHFARMAALFNLDLHLDGRDVCKKIVPSLPVNPPPGLTAKELGDLASLLPPGMHLHLRGNRTQPHPIACGGGLVIRYNPADLLAPHPGTP